MNLAGLSPASPIGLQFCGCGMRYGNGIWCILQMPSHFIWRKKEKIVWFLFNYEKAAEKCKATEVIVFKRWDKSGDVQLETGDKFRFEKFIRVGEELFYENRTHLITCSREKL